MGENSEKTLHYGTNLSLESIKVIAESIGVANLPDDAAKELADDISYKIKKIVEDASKFMNHGKRTKLCLGDIDQSLKIRNLEPQYGFIAPDFIPFRFASGGGRELHFIDEKEIDLNDVLAAPAPKAPLEVSLRAHWLCVDGVQVILVFLSISMPLPMIRFVFLANCTRKSSTAIKRRTSTRFCKSY